MRVLAWRLVLLAAGLVAWELASDRLLPAFYISRPSAIAGRLVQAFASGAIVPHLATTLVEMVVGFSIGLPLGIAVGLLLGTFRFSARVFQPFIILLYSIPLLALAPLFILWFGVGWAPKIVLVAILVFFFVFFNTYVGARELDQDLVASLRVMGANWGEVFRKVTLPASVVWIFTGVKIAAPYALAGAVVGEMLVSRSGLGLLLMQATQMNDMAALYAVLLVIMVLGILASEAVERSERLVLRRQGRTAGG